MKSKRKQIKYTLNVQIIYDYMKKHNLDKQQFSKLCNFSVNTLNKVLSGFTKIRFNTLFNLLRVLKVPSKDLCGY